MVEHSNGSSNALQHEVRVAKNWAGVAGLWKFDDSRAEYYGPDAEQAFAPLGLAVCELPFRDGEAFASITLSSNSETAAGILFRYQSVDAGYYAAALGSHDRAYALSEYVPGHAWVSLVGAGSVKNLVAGKTYRLAVAINGQTLRLSVDGVNVISHVFRRPIDGTGLGIFAWGNKKTVFENLSVEASDPRLFVIMPFKEPFDTIYREVIAPVAKDLQFDVIRIDEVHGPGVILEDIQQEISRSHAVIAEVSSHNPNVFYELGFAHALGKPAVLLVRRQEEQSMPFDIRGYRAIFYDDSIGGKRVVERKLREHLRAVLQSAANYEEARA